jgi:hypothetical protein
MSKTSATEGIAQRALAAAVQEPSGEKGFGLYAQKVEKPYSNLSLGCFFLKTPPNLIPDNGL